jgi:hypothetical protein
MGKLCPRAADEAAFLMGKLTKITLHDVPLPERVRAASKLIAAELAEAPALMLAALLPSNRLYLISEQAALAHQHRAGRAGSTPG